MFLQDAEAIEVLLRQDIDLGARDGDPCRPVPSPEGLPGASLSDSCCSPEPLDGDDGDALVPIKPVQQVTDTDRETQ